MPAPLPRPPRRPPPPSPAPQPTTYVLIPLRLIEDLRDSPAAVGAFALIGRLYLIAGEAIPLSPGDLQAYDPLLSYGAARRALDRLVAAGYALAQGTAGHKLCYRPTWGRVHSTVIAWERAAGELGRPGHIKAVRVDDRLLDLCLGRLRPHHAHRAVVARYLAAPALGLRDVGAYALARAGIPAPSPALTSLGLLDAAGAPLPLPDDLALLERAAGRAEGPALSPAGMRRVSHTGPDATAAIAAIATPAPGRPIGGGDGAQIGGVIGGRDRGQGPTTAPEHPAAATTLAEPPSHGWTEFHGVNGDSTTPPVPAPWATRGGGGTTETEHPPHTQKRSAAPGADAHRPAPSASTHAVAETTAFSPSPAPTAPATTVVSRLLRGVGVRADVATAFSDRDPAQVERVIAQARARSGVRDLAAWVVSALRALPATAEVAPPPPKVSENAILFHPSLSGYERQRWLARFRRAEPADRPAVLARMSSEHPTPQELSNVDAA